MNTSEILFSDIEIYKTYYDAQPYTFKEYKDDKERVTEIYKLKRYLPIANVSNIIHFMDKQEIIIEIYNLVASDFRSMYLTDLKRNPIDILYHTIFNITKQEWFYYTYIIENNEIVKKNKINEDTADEIRHYLMSKPNIKNDLLSRLDNQNMLHILCAYCDVSIRKIDDHKYVLVYAENNGIVSDEIFI